MKTSPETYNLLVIEDDVSEQKLIRILVKNSGYSCTIKFLDDGTEALDFINKYPAPTSENEKIHLIFLDLNLPKVNGIDVLKTIKQSVLLRSTPIVILTTSNNENDIFQAYEAGASGFVRKPATIEEYERTLNAILRYWFDICILK